MSSNALETGTPIGQRFVIEAPAGSGGMGTVYRGHDKVLDTTVAIKLLHVNHGGHDEADRFAREVQILSELKHPGIVSYVAHGIHEGGQPYLAMEWLQGEDLSSRLKKGALSLPDSLTLIRRVAEALDVAHQRQIIHRDIKPSNLYLRNGEIDRVTLLDFGVARRMDSTTAVTRTGLIIGTPEYMAPEQASGQRDIGPAADIFSLGCVLFECLTGQPPFVAEMMAGVMAKILFEPAPALRSRHAGMPEWLDALIARMLEKDFTIRLQDAGRLREVLTSLESNATDLSALRVTRPSARYATRTPAEQQLVSVLLSSVPSLVPDWDSDTNIASPADSEPARELQRALAIYGAKVEILADGSIVAMLTQSHQMTATDLVARAARCALALKQRFPDAFSTLTTGRALLGGRMPIGDAIERSAWLREAGISSENFAAAETDEVIFLDEVTAGLLDARFDTRRLPTGVFALRRERVSLDEGRSLMGRATPCVGRDRELAVLDLLFTECKDDSVTRVALVTAPAGMGKSRLRHEFLRRLQARNEAVQVLFGRADPLATGSPYALLGQTLRQLCVILDGESPAAQQAKLWQHVHSRLPDPSVRRVIEFIGELCGVRFPDADSVQLRAAREDARIMADQLHRAFVDLMRAECERCPVLLVLEDLQWGDAPTLRIIDSALRELQEQPLMVLALARPEVETVFPRLWLDRRRQDLRLEGLHKKASERLVRQVLGSDASASVIARIVEQSTGNPLFLEELIRAVAEGKGDELPETVLAMLQSRLLRLDPGARRTLRAASIFGQSFWHGGLQKILRTEPGSLDVDHWLLALIENEVLEQQKESRFPGERQYRFRHGLLRDAAYSLLTSDHRQLGHRMAADYLEEMGETDPVVLAEHYERGMDRSRASSLYLRAAELAHRRGDGDTAVAWVWRGLECGPDEIARVGLLVVLCQVYLWRNQLASAAEFAGEVMQLSEPGSPSWAIAAAAILAHARYDDQERFLSTLTLIRKVEPEIDAVSKMSFALAVGIYMLDTAGEFALAETCLRRIHEIVDPVAANNPIARAWMNRAHAHHEAWRNEDPWTGLRYAEASKADCLETNHTRGALDAQVFIAMNAWALGAAERAERAIRETLTIREDLGLVSSLRALIFVEILCARGALDEAEKEARALLDAEPAAVTARGRGLSSLSDVQFCRGDFAAAEKSLREAIDVLAKAPLANAAAHVSLARVMLATGRLSDAVAPIETAMRVFEKLGTYAGRGILAFQVQAEVQDALGNRAVAQQIVARACAHLVEKSQKIGDPQLRKSYLADVAAHRRLFALAAQWGESVHITGAEY